MGGAWVAWSVRPLGGFLVGRGGFGLAFSLPGSIYEAQATLDPTSALLLIPLSLRPRIASKVSETPQGLTKGEGN